MRKLTFAVLFSTTLVFGIQAAGQLPGPTTEEIQQAVRAYILAEVNAIDTVQRKDVPPITEQLGVVADQMLPNPASVQVTVNAASPVASDRYTALVTIAGNLGTETRVIEFIRNPNGWLVMNNCRPDKNPTFHFKCEK